MHVYSVGAWLALNINVNIIENLEMCSEGLKNTGFRMFKQGVIIRIKYILNRTAKKTRPATIIQITC